MIFGLLPKALEIPVITVVLVAVLIKTASRAKRAANGNLKQELKPSQRAIYGPVWLLAALFLVGCLVAVVNTAGTLLGILYFIVLFVVVTGTGVDLSIVWPLPRE